MITPTPPNGTQAPYDLVMDVTPDLACRWLEANTQNRAINPAHVDSLARDMKAGRWHLTHQGIAFDTHGLLVDGQHRLWAVLEADMTVTMRVFFNQPPENRCVLDTGQRRSNFDILLTTGRVGKVTTRDLATLRAMLAGPSSHVTQWTAGEEAEQYSRHREAIQFAVEHLPTVAHRGLATAQVRAVIARAYYSADHSRLIHFCDVLRSGVPDGEADHDPTLQRSATPYSSIAPS